MRYTSSRTYHGTPVPSASGSVSKVSKRTWTIEMQPKWVETERPPVAMVWFENVAARPISCSYHATGEFSVSWSAELCSVFSVPKV